MSNIEDLEVKIKELDQELLEAEAQLSKWKRKCQTLREKKITLKNLINQEKSTVLANKGWEDEKYEWSSNVRRIAKEVFNIETFRPKQLSAINATLSSQHALIVMPTGAGKSLCYQLPALLMPGITVVVSPLVSLMEDQVRSLKEKNVDALLITATSSKEDTNYVLSGLKGTVPNFNTKLLYVTPERFAKSKRFMANLQKCYADSRLQRIAIDEVHCCSQWGHDFRPDYKYLGILAGMFPNIPILGLTATATSHVLTDVQKMLNIQGCLIIKSTFNRPNLFYKILEKPSSQEKCLNILERLLKYRYKNESGIIYVNSIKDCGEVADGLKKKGLNVGSYHANMEAGMRSKIHMKWHNKDIQVIVATVAFGMGIDKPDVRFVIHYTISKSMENYYQESGRAGRDGALAECVTLYRMQDIFKVSTMVFSSVGNLDHLYGMIKYCLTGNLCRRQIIAEHFDENWGSEDCYKMCDVCLNSKSDSKEISIEGYCKILGEVIDKAEQMDVKLTAQKLLDAWFLKGPVQMRHKGPEPKISRELAEDVIAYLLIHSYLVEDFHFTAYSTISYIKKGPNMDLTKDPSFILKMNIRKYTAFDLDTKLSNGHLSNCDAKKRRSSDEIMKKPKKSKPIVIDSDSE